MNTAEQVPSYVLPAVLLAAGLCLTALLVWLAWLPGELARRHNQPGASRIALLGWLSIVIWPLWIVAMIMACRRPVLRAERIIRVPTSRLHARTIFDGVHDFDGAEGFDGAQGH